MTIYENKKLPVLLFFLKPLARAITLFMPNLESELYQSGLKVKKEDFVLISIFLSLFYSVFIFIILEIIFSDLGKNFSDNLLLPIVISLVIGFFSLFSNLNYPKLLVLRKVKNTKIFLNQ